MQLHPFSKITAPFEIVMQFCYPLTFIIKGLFGHEIKAGSVLFWATTNTTIVVAIP
jgi:hypothetical protein